MNKFKLVSALSFVSLLTISSLASAAQNSSHLSNQWRCKLDKSSKKQITVEMMGDDKISVSRPNTFAPVVYHLDTPEPGQEKISAHVNDKAEVTKVFTAPADAGTATGSVETLNLTRVANGHRLTIASNKGTETYFCNSPLAAPKGDEQPPRH